MQHTESLQVVVPLVRWVRLQAHLHPALRWFHKIPNGGAMSVRAGARNKAEGVLPGVPDHFLPMPRDGYHGLYLEAKAPGKLARLSPEQKEFRAWCEQAGYKHVVYEDWVVAAQEISDYLGIKLTFS